MGRTTGWTMAKYALAVLGLAIVVGADQLGRPVFGYVGLLLIGTAFLLRFLPRRHR